MKINNMIIIMIGIIFALMVLKLKREYGFIDQQTIDLCTWYSKQDHSTEIIRVGGKMRYDKMGHMWTNFDWYKLCINTIRRLR